MKISIYGDNKKELKLSIYNWLALNKISASFIYRKIKKAGVKIKRKSFFKFVRLCKKYTKTHPNWKIVEVESDGSNVIIEI